MFKIRQHEPRSLKWWFNHREMIDMSPTYQRRGSLWSEKKRALLIDSIINGFDLPKFYFADFNYGDNKLNEKGRAYAVIDGKQRLETLFLFFEDKLSLSANIKYRKNPQIDIAGLTYSQLQESGFAEIAESVEKFQPTVVSVISDDEDVIDDLFVRLNSGIEVNGAERRNAMPGIVPKVIRKLSSHVFFQENIAFATNRMQEFNVAAKLLLIEHQNTFVDTKAANLDKFVVEGTHDKPRAYEESGKRVAAILTDLAGCFGKQDPLLKSTGQIPVYYWVIKNQRINPRKFHEFLVWFSNRLDENFDLQKAGDPKTDIELSEYYRMSRTTNDKASLEGRYLILIKWMKRF